MSEGDKDKTFQMRVSDVFLRQIDDWRRSSPDLPSRAEAVRRLINAGIGKIGIETFDQFSAEIAALKQIIQGIEDGWLSPSQWVGRKADAEHVVGKYKKQIETLEEAQNILAEGAAQRLRDLLEQRGHREGH